MKKKTAAKPKKKPKKIKNGHNKNGHNKNGAFEDPNLVSEWLASTPNVVVGPPPAPPRSTFRDLTTQLGAEVAEFRDAMIAKYSNIETEDGAAYDLRKNLAWYMEQYGNGILADMERHKRQEREKIIAETRAREEAEAATKEVAPK